MESRLASCTGDLFEETVVDVRSGEDRVCVIAVPTPDRVGLSDDGLLVLVEERVGQLEDIQSHEVPKGIVRVSREEHAQWARLGLLTPLGKLVRGKISLHYAQQLDALYDFKFRSQCLALIDGSDLRRKLVGLISLLIESDPQIVEQYTGHLNSLGINSLGLARLSSALKEPQFNSREVSSAAVATMSLDGLVQCVRTGAVRFHEQDELIQQMITDSEDLEGIKQRLESQPSKEKIEQILVTGGTGALGAVIIVNLLKCATNVKIACLVRANSEAQATERLRRSLCAAAGVEALSADDVSRVTAIVGHLDQPKLGMEQSIYNDTAATTDAIIHCAAVVNHVTPYSAHRASNVVGTRNLLELSVASSTNAAFHFVSTANVILTNTAAFVMESEPVQISRAALNSNGYTQFKLVSEVLCWNASNYGLPLVVYRPGIVSSHSGNGFCKSGQ